MKPIQAAHLMLKRGSRARRESERMLGKKFEDMTQSERVFAATILAAFFGYSECLDDLGAVERR